MLKSYSLSSFVKDPDRYCTQSIIVKISFNFFLNIEWRLKIVLPKVNINLLERIYPLFLCNTSIILILQ